MRLEYLYMLLTRVLIVRPLAASTRSNIIKVFYSLTDVSCTTVAITTLH